MKHDFVLTKTGSNEGLPAKKAAGYSALLVGATGLIGKALLGQLLRDQANGVHGAPSGVGLDRGSVWSAAPGLLVLAGQPGSVWVIRDADQRRQPGAWVPANRRLPWQFRDRGSRWPGP